MIAILSLYLIVGFFVYNAMVEYEVREGSFETVVEKVVFAVLWPVWVPLMVIFILLAALQAKSGE